MNETRTALISGATSGIGSEIAAHLVRKGYNLIVLGRSIEKLDSLSKQLNAINPKVSIDKIFCELSSFDAIMKACEQIKKSQKSIDIMILNAGLWNFQFIETSDKIEETFQVNLLSPIVIFNELKLLMPKHEEAKVIFTTSGLHQGVINFSDIEFRENFSGFKAYRQSKLGIILLTRWLSKQASNSGISFYSVHPGMVNTQLGRNAGWLSRNIFKLFGKSPEKGAQTHVYLIDAKTKDLVPGECYTNNSLMKTSADSYDMEAAEKLWETVQKYLNK